MTTLIAFCHMTVSQKRLMQNWVQNVCEFDALQRAPFGLKSADAAVETVEDPHPRVVFLSNDHVASDDLAGLIDDLASDDVPLIFCVGAGDTPAPKTRIAMAQRRIDLLAIEQNGSDLRVGPVKDRT